VRDAMFRTNTADLVVLCVDKHTRVLAELERWSHQAQAGAGSDYEAVGDPDFSPTTPSSAIRHL